MKKLILLCICSMSLAISLFAQVPTASPVASPPAATPIATATVNAAMTAATAASTSPSDLAARIHQKLEKKTRGPHGINIDTGDKDDDADLRKMRDLIAIPIVAIVFLSIFGAPVLIVMMIGMFAFFMSRMRERTLRMMVEKGQPVPAELLVPHTRAVRQRSDV